MIGECVQLQLGVGRLPLRWLWPRKKMPAPCTVAIAFRLVKYQYQQCGRIGGGEGAKAFEHCHSLTVHGDHQTLLVVPAETLQLQDFRFSMALKVLVDGGHLMQGRPQWLAGDNGGLNVRQQGQSLVDNAAIEVAVGELEH